MMIKVLNVLTGGLRRDGITSTQLIYMKNIDHAGLQIDIAAVHNNAPDVIEEFKQYGCNVIEFPDRKSHLFSYCKKLFYLLRMEKYDVIHVHGNSALMSIELMIAKLANVKVRIAHSRNTQCEHVKADKLLRPVFYKSYNVALACGEDAGKWLFGGRPYIVLHNGKELEKFRFSANVRTEIREKYRIRDRIAIGFVGNIKYQKNPDFLIEVFAAVYQKKKDVVLFVIGDGEDRRRIEQKIAELGLSEYVVFTGRIANVHELLQGMDIMLLPSRFEGLPNVVLEWQVAGLPCIVSSKITKECAVTDLVSFLPIDEGVDSWVREINKTTISADRTAASQESCNMMRKAGFDINENAKFLKELYQKAVEA